MTLFVLDLSLEVNKGLACQFEVFEKSTRRACGAQAVAAMGQGKGRQPLCREHARWAYGQKVPNVVSADRWEMPPGAVRDLMRGWAQDPVDDEVPE